MPSLWKRPMGIREDQGTSEEKSPKLIQRQAIPTSLQENILQVDSIISHPITDRIAILRKGLDYFSEEQRLRYGHTMHLILAEIETTEDIEGALERAISQGLIAPDEEDDVRQSIQRVVSHSDCARWFDGSGVVIGGGLEGSRRPDRIIFYADEGADRDQTSVEIIDYKFGHFDKRYYAQIQGYQALLQRMGYRDVKGWLCYIEKDKIKVVPVPPKR